MKGVTIRKIDSKFISEYYKNPRLCKQCGNVIPIKDYKSKKEIEESKFCGSSCSAIFNNKNRAKKQIHCVTCNKTITKGSKSGKCAKCNGRIEKIGGKTKKELFDSRKNYQSARSSIRKSAERIYLKFFNHKVCYVCGYDRHVEISHIKSVSCFSDDALISEINDIKNLVALCPNHHWEYDNGFLKIKLPQ